MFSIPLSLGTLCHGTRRPQVRPRCMPAECRRGAPHRSSSEWMVTEWMHISIQTFTHKRFSTGASVLLTFASALLRLPGGAVGLSLSSGFQSTFKITSNSLQHHASYAGGDDEPSIPRLGPRRHPRASWWIVASTVGIP
ncbi:hypothetical protein DAEQUDRAFT_86020 [Daedalea quercina L-15889]|uniref:Uncharacterized protein n=1 Tax=Daedalea quercina L-15889 TaxID=1314783 RepID=A0A165L0N5_9APHY|nr:hypothetical protein DAEQUDRAFT_86020 [Daedalea quercina L-15889]